MDNPTPILYDPKTSQDLYLPYGSNGMSYGLHTVEKLARDLAAVGVIKFFSGLGPDPTSLPGYNQAAVWHR
jgi:hypothetical protein